MDETQYRILRRKMREEQIRRREERARYRVEELSKWTEPTKWEDNQHWQKEVFSGKENTAEPKGDETKDKPKYFYMAECPSCRARFDERQCDYCPSCGCKNEMKKVMDLVGMKMPSDEMVSIANALAKYFDVEVIVWPESTKIVARTSSCNDMDHTHASFENKDFPDICIYIVEYDTELFGDYAYEIARPRHLTQSTEEMIDHVLGKIDYKGRFYDIRRSFWKVDHIVRLFTDGYKKKTRMFIVL